MKAERKPHLYLSGPMTGRPEHNFPTFFMAAARLRCLGYRVTNPAELHVAAGLAWAEYLRTDIKHLMDCEAIAMLPDWQDSKGARLEHHNAVELGMPVLIVEELLEPLPSDNGVGEPDLWVSATEIQRLAAECPVHATYALRSGDGLCFLRGDRECNRWAFQAVKGWRAASVMPRVDLLLSDDEMRMLQRAQAPYQSITYRETGMGRVLCSFAKHNAWAFEAVQRMRLSQPYREAA